MKRKGWGVLAAFSALLALVAAFALPVSAQAAEGDVARIEGTSEEFPTLQAAISEAENGDTITLLDNASLPSTNFPSGKEITIDGAGKLIDADRSYLNIAGDVTFKNCIINFHGVPNGHWMYIYMASNGSLTFESATVSIDGTDAADNTTAMYFPEPGTPRADVSIIATTLEIKNCDGNGISWGGRSNNGYNKLTISENSYVTIENCAEMNTSGGGGIIGTFDVTVTDSTLDVHGNKSYGSNGSNNYISNSTVTYDDNGTHGLSATNLVIENNSDVSADNNGYYGVYANGDFKVDKTSTLTVTHNSYKGDYAGLKLYKGVTDGVVENGAVVSIKDNYCSGLSNNGKVVFEEGSDLTITGNTNDQGGATSSHGGGIYNSGSGADLTLPSNAIIYNNHALTDGDDIYNNSNSKIAFGQTGSDWKLDGVGIDEAADDCIDGITGWFADSANARWEAHADTYDGIHVEPYAFDGATTTVTGSLALKAAHGLGVVAVDPADITIYMGGTEGYEGVINDNAQIAGSNSLPEPGFYFILPEDINQAFAEAGITAQSEAADLSQYMTVYTHGYNGESGELHWKLEKYGENHSGANGQFIYRIVPDPTDGQEAVPVRLQFKADDGTIMTSDNFDPAAEGTLQNTYEMQLYAALVDANQVVFEVDINGEKFYNSMELQTGALNVRYVTGDQDSMVSDVLTSEDALSAAKAEAPGKAYAMMPEDAVYYINDSQVDIAQNVAPSLLFDNVVSDHTTNGAADYDQQLANRAVDVVASQGANLTSPMCEAKYLDLVDANNGNVWLTSNQPVTVYWPYPAGTDENTEFHLVHFTDLDRTMENGAIEDAIAASNTEYLAVENTPYGVRFTTDGFSPFVLMWEGATIATEPGGDGGSLAATGAVAFSKAELVERLGCCPRTLDRALTMLRRQGHVVSTPVFAPSGAQLGNEYRATDEGLRHADSVAARRTSAKELMAS